MNLPKTYSTCEYQLFEPKSYLCISYILTQILTVKFTFLTHCLLVNFTYFNPTYLWVLLTLTQNLPVKFSFFNPLLTCEFYLF